MLSVEETKLRVLSELQEAGEENVAAMANTIFDLTGDRQEIENLKTALEALVHEGLVRIAYRSDLKQKLVPLSEELSLAVASKLQSVLRLRESDMHWTWVGEDRPHVVATETGLQRADETLELYGYQWWRSRT